MALNISSIYPSLTLAYLSIHSGFIPISLRNKQTKHKTMKKNLLLLSMALIAGVSNAQITVTQNDMPSVGDVIMGYNDNATQPAGWIITPGSASAQTWDYSTNWTIADTSWLEFMNPAGNPGASLFPGSNFCAHYTSSSSGPLSSFHEYFNTSANDFTANGLYSSNATLTYNAQTTGNILYQWPLTYGSSYSYNRTQTTVIVFSTPGTPASKTKSYTSGTKVVDAWGTLIAPDNTYQVLRLKDDVTSKVDSSFTDTTGTGQQFVFTYTTNNLPQNVNYAFMANVNFPEVMSIQANRTTGAIRLSSYRSNLPTALRKPTSESAQANVFPNPANGMVTMNNTVGKNAMFELFDLAGVKVFEYTLHDINTLSIETSGFANGLYMYKISSRNGNKCQIGKLMIEH